MYYRSIESDRAEIAYRQEQIGRSFRRWRRAEPEPEPEAPRPAAEADLPTTETRRPVRLAA